MQITEPLLTLNLVAEILSSLPGLLRPPANRSGLSPAWEHFELSIFYIHLSIYLSTCQPVYLSTCLSFVYLSLSLSLSLCIDTLVQFKASACFQTPESQSWTPTMESPPSLSI